MKNPSSDQYLPSEQERPSQSVHAGKNATVVGRDFSSTTNFNFTIWIVGVLALGGLAWAIYFKSGNWGVAIVNCAVLALIILGLLNGLVQGAALAETLFYPEKILAQGSCSASVNLMNSRFNQLERTVQE